MKRFVQCYASGYLVGAFCACSLVSSVCGQATIPPSTKTDSTTKTEPATKSPPGTARPEEKTEAFKLPSDPASWINSAPLTNSALEGKGAVLWFYEEQCPRCREKWPGMLQTAKQFEGKPVVFIAINSGNPRPVVQSYLQQLRITWPSIVDPLRLLEQAASVGEINLQNIYQVRVLTADGKITRGDPNDLAGAATIALKGAAWKVDPAIIPANLHSVWQAVELGNYANTSPALKQATSSRDEATKTAGTKLMAAIQQKIDAAIAEANAALEKGDKVTALKLFSELPQRFPGFDLPAEVTSKRKVLAIDPQIIATQKAEKELEGVRKMLEKSQAPAIRKRAETILKKIMQDAAGTETAKQAEDLLNKLGN